MTGHLCVNEFFVVGREVHFLQFVKLDVVIPAHSCRQ